MRRIQSCEEFGEGHAGKGTALAVTESREEFGIGKNQRERTVCQEHGERRDRR